MASGPKSIFVTASGTEIGKTYVAECLIRNWRAHGRQVEALKPVITGFDPHDVLASDTGRLLTALGKPPTPENIDRISPWRFALAAAPTLAYATEDRSVPYDELRLYCGAAEQRARETGSHFLIEGIGGVMVPLDDSHTVLDLIADLRIPALLVTGSYLGSLSHTLTACAVLEYRGIPLDRIVISQTRDSNVDITFTRSTLGKHVDTRIDVVPFMDTGSSMNYGW